MTHYTSIQAIHSLKNLWVEYKKLAAVDVRYKPYINQLDEYIDDFCEIDDTSETFRYPFSHEERRHLKELGCINIGIFGNRFLELYKFIDELGYLTEFLAHEYREGTIIRGLSRTQIEQIAVSLPPKTEWVKDDFLRAKEKILKKYGISSNKFSRVLTLIKGHREFASYIGMELPLKEIDYDGFKIFIAIYRKFTKKLKTDYFIAVINDYADAVCQELSEDNICAILTLFDIGYFNLYSEAYERVLEEKKGADVHRLVFSDISVQRGIVLEKIQISLKLLGQETLLKAFVSR